MVKGQRRVLRQRKLLPVGLRIAEFGVLREGGNEGEKEGGYAG